MKLKNKIQMFKEFGFRAAFSSVCSSALRHPMAITRWKDRCIIDWLRKNYSDVITRHKQDAIRDDESNEPGIIWSIWWQGEDNAPEIVKMCLASINRHRGSHPFIIITKHNYQEYISLPEHIIAKAESGTMSLAHFSDILRVYLLYHYGGLWLDATMFAAGVIPDEIFRSGYFSIKGGFNPKSYAVTMGRWASFLQAAHKGNMLCGFALDFQIEYWKKQTIPIDYILIDYVYALAREEFPECRRLIDAVPVNNRSVDDLAPILSNKWDSVKFEELTRTTSFFKLTWKREFLKSIDGQDTFYGRILKRAGEDML